VIVACAVSDYTTFMGVIAVTIRCPSCSGLVQKLVPVSYDTLGGEYWTYESIDSAIFHADAPFAKCPRCKSIFWLEDAPEVDTQERRLPRISDPGVEDCFETIRKCLPDPKKREIELRLFAWRAANDIMRWRWSVGAFVMQALGVVLIAAFSLMGWVASDAFRTIAVVYGVAIAALTVPKVTRSIRMLLRRRHLIRQFGPPTGELLLNREALIKLLDETDTDHRLAKAEIMRELRQFAQAQALLAWDWPPGALPHAITIRRLAAIGNSRAARVNENDPEIRREVTAAWSKWGDTAAESHEYEIALSHYVEAAKLAPHNYPDLTALHTKIMQMNQQAMH
jgi:hypothetical protein